MDARDGARAARDPETWAGAEVAPAEQAPPPPPSNFERLSIARDRLTWHDRIIGSLGLVVVVAVGAAALAFAVSSWARPPLAPGEGGRQLGRGELRRDVLELRTTGASSDRRRGAGPRGCISRPVAERLRVGCPDRRSPRRRTSPIAASRRWRSATTSGSRPRARRAGSASCRPTPEQPGELDRRIRMIVDAEIDVPIVPALVAAPSRARPTTRPTASHDGRRPRRRPPAAPPGDDRTGPPRPRRTRAPAPTRPAPPPRCCPARRTRRPSRRPPSPCSSRR